jgi:type II secretory pathway pseudopilin PulG
MRRKERDGFTLIDAVLAITIVTVLAASTTPLIYGYFTRGKLSATTRDIVSSLRYAQIQSQAGIDGEPWGVNIGSGVITTYRGESFAARDVAYDQTVSFPADTIVTGTAEYQFTEYTGRTAAGTLVLTASSGMTQSIDVNAFGTVGY